MYLSQRQWLIAALRGATKWIRAMIGSVGKDSSFASGQRSGAGTGSRVKILRLFSSSPIPIPSSQAGIAVMDVILLLVAFLGLVLRNKLPYAKAVSAVVLLFVSIRGIYSFVQRRLRFRKLV